MVLLQATRLPNGPLQLESVRRPQAVFVAGRAGYCSRDVGLSFFFCFFFVCRQNPSIFHRKLGQALPFFRYFKPNNDVFAHPNQVVSGFKLHYKEKLRLNDLLFCRIVCNSYSGDRVDCVASAAVCTSELYQSAPEQPQRCR